MARRDLLCGLMQIARAGVIAKPGPQVENFVERRIGEIGHRREARHKAFKIGDNGRNLSLLQHHF